MVRRFGDASVLNHRFVEEREPLRAGLWSHGSHRCVAMSWWRTRLLISFVNALWLNCQQVRKLGRTIRTEAPFFSYQIVKQRFRNNRDF